MAVVAHQNENRIIKMAALFEPLQPLTEVAICSTDQVVAVVGDLTVKTKDEFRAVFVDSE